MFLSEPTRTSYDLQFSLLGFPIRVHPAFFLMPVLLGRGLAGGAENVGVGLAIVVGLFFVSVLVHELGHALAFRYYGVPSHIVMYWMGGMAIAGGGGAWSKPQRSLQHGEHMVVSFAGPLAGLLLVPLLILLGFALGGELYISQSFIPLPLISFRETALATNSSVWLAINGGILINLLLNLFNLVPVYPLDGGQILHRFMLRLDPVDGVRNSIYVSIAAAVAMALVALSYDQKFMALFFAFFAWSNFQRLQMSSGPRW